MRVNQTKKKSLGLRESNYGARDRNKFDVLGRLKASEKGREVKAGPAHARLLGHGKDFGLYPTCQRLFQLEPLHWRSHWRIVGE